MNRLRFEKSPYLLQHKENPVHWFAWSEEAFAEAQRLDRPVFLSIGYSTCYWCHVMEQDSFENDDVADLLNAGFVCVKVDREERPDLDQIYMDAVVGIAGHGGWPMSVFLTPEKRPFFGGTFFPKQQFIPLLSKISEVWHSDRNSIVTSADRIFGFLNRQSAASDEPLEPVPAFRDALEYFRRNFDAEFGGFGQAPKFPQPANLELLLRLWRRTGDDSILLMVRKTIDAMCRGGIYDQVGGGFHRYATDQRWLVPHFEKMLYDNAQLVSVLVQAFQATKDRAYLTRATETLDYCLRDMRLKEGGFAAAEDAGEVGNEGEFYVWEAAHLEHSLSPQEYDLVTETFGVTAHGNFESETNILAIDRAVPLSVFEDQNFRQLREKLFRLREVRDRPLRDTKILTAWNGLMLTALGRTYAVTGEGRYLTAATETAAFIRESLWKNGQLLRSYCDGEAKIPGFLEDYSYLIQGLLSLYEVSSLRAHYDWAVELQHVQDQLFWDGERGGYYFSPAGLTELIVRKKDFNDGAVPSGNSISALNLLKFCQLSGEASFLTRYHSLVRSMAPHAAKYPAAYPTLLCAIDFELDRFRATIVSSPTDRSWQEAQRTIAQNYLPNDLVARARNDGPPLVQDKELPDFEVFICDSAGCAPPEKKIEAAVAKLRTTPTLSLLSGSGG